MLHKCVSISPVWVNHPPDSKDGRNDSYQYDHCCHCTHQDQHQPLSLEKYMQRLLYHMNEWRWTRITNLLTGVSKCVTGDEDLAGGAGLVFTPQGLMTVWSMSWGVNPPSHLSLGTLRYLQTYLEVCEYVQQVCVFILNQGMTNMLPCCQKLILLSIQAELQGFVCVGLSHTLWGVHVTVVTVVTVEKSYTMKHSPCQPKQVLIWEAWFYVPYVIFSDAQAGALLLAHHKASSISAHRLSLQPPVSLLDTQDAAVPLQVRFVCGMCQPLLIVFGRTW